jgi:hypothetical protein
MLSSVRRFALTAALTAAASVFLSSAATARPKSIRHLAAQEVELATIAHRIATANAHVCDQPEDLSGLVLHDLTQYDRAVRPAVSQAFAINSGVGVLDIVPGSAAANAGLRVDDEILAVGPFNVQHSAARRKPKSNDKMAEFHAALQAALASGPTELVVRRRGNLVKLPMSGQPGCGGRLLLTSSSTLNAYSDGDHVFITTAMSRFSRGADEIAFVIAHEMAHNILGHSSESGKRGIFGFLAVRKQEIEADSYAVQLLANAGYRPEGAISFLRSARRKLWWNFSLDHPGFGKRIQIVTAAARAAGTQ